MVIPSGGHSHLNNPSSKVNMLHSVDCDCSPTMLYSFLPFVKLETLPTGLGASRWHSCLMSCCLTATYRTYFKSISTDLNDPTCIGSPKILTTSRNSTASFHASFNVLIIYLLYEAIMKQIALKGE